MTWADFWALIGTLDGEATQENCQHLAEELSRRSVPDVIGFAERHAEALYRLDQEKFGTLPVVDLTTRDGSPFPQSSDVFLYTRCAVVAAGQTVWESVFFDVDKFAPYTSTEYDGEWGRRATEGGEDRVVATQSIERHVRDPLEGEPPDRGVQPVHTHQTIGQYCRSSTSPMSNALISSAKYPPLWCAELEKATAWTTFSKRGRGRGRAVSAGLEVGTQKPDAQEPIVPAVTSHCPQLRQQ
jgi:hypothetical protein